MSGYEREYTNPALASTKTGTGAQTITVSADAKKRYGLLAFSGFSKTQNFTIEVKVNGTAVWTHYGVAGTTSGAVFDDPKIIHTSENESLSITITPDVSDDCGVNLSYRQI